jgi:hypothetical protein
MFKDRIKKLAGDLVGEIVDAGFDAAVDAMRRRREAPIVEPDPEPAAPPDWQLSRARCKDCNGPQFFRRANLVQYMCRTATCCRREGVSRQEAADREGIPL